MNEGNQDSNKTLSNIAGFVVVIFFFIFVVDLVANSKYIFLKADSISANPQRYAIAQQGEIAIRLRNYQPSSQMTIPNLTVLLPKDFFHGFIILYPTIPEDSQVRTGGVYDLLETSVTFKDITIKPDSTYIVKIPIVANIPGDYSGWYEVFVGLGGIPKLNPFVESLDKVNIHVVIVPK